MGAIVILGDVPGQQTAFQAPDLVPIQVIEGIANDGRRSIRAGTQPVDGQYVERLRRVLVAHYFTKSRNHQITKSPNHEIQYDAPSNCPEDLWQMNGNQRPTTS